MASDDMARIKLLHMVEPRKLKLPDVEGKSEGPGFYKNKDSTCRLGAESSGAYLLVRS